MKVLVMAPQPFYQERGTPIAVDLLVKSLAQAGHEVDLLTFGEGLDRDYPGVHHHRLRHWFGIKGIRPGLSAKKIILDFFFFLRFVIKMIQNRYDVVHSVEESVFMSFLICPIFGVSYVYDMDSLMTTQIIDKAPALKPVEGVFRWIESLPMRFATAVVPVCQALADEVSHYRKQGVFILKDVSLANSDEGGSELDVLDVKAQVGDKALPILMYIGNLESYQGIDLMIDGFAKAVKTTPANLVIIGGEDEHIHSYQMKAAALGIEQHVYLLGKQPVAHLFALMAQADILLSPRIHGVNTPMKVYSYLDSGVPVVATDLPTHSQVMDSSTAMLVAPNDSAMAEGVITLLADKSMGQKLAENARELIRQEHSEEAFKKRLAEIYAYLAALNH